MRFKEYLNESQFEFITDFDQALAWMRKNGKTEINPDDLTLNQDGTFSYADGLDFSNYKMKQLPMRFKRTGSFNVDNTDLRTFEGCPEEVDGDFDASYINVDSWDYIPRKITGDCDLGYGCYKLKTLVGIADRFDHIGAYFELPGGIKEGGIGLIMIDGLTEVMCMDYNTPFTKALEIIKKYLGRPEDIFQCQTELMEAGLEKFAQV